MRRTQMERMDKKEFRMSLINRIKDLSPKERARVVEEIIQGKYQIPFSKKVSVSKTTIYRWLKEFREGKDAGEVLLVKVRKDKDTFPSLSGEQQEALLNWRSENLYRTGEDLRDELLEHESTRMPPLPSVSTITRFLSANGLSRAGMLLKTKSQAKIRLAFEAEYVNQIWMADTKGPDIYVIDPHDPTKRVLAKPICIVDDFSRFIVAVRYVIVEDEAAVMELFCLAILLFGIPDILYLDRGGPYMGKSLKRAATLIGCNILHTPKRDPSAKGKSEKVLRTIHERFEHEMKARGKDGVELTEYNEYLMAYLTQDYHRKVHAATGQTPEERFLAHPPQLRRWISKDSLYLIFLPRREAKVTKTALVKVNNLQYLVPDASLMGKWVEVRFKHSENDLVYIWFEDKYYGEARLFTEENDFLQREAMMEMLQRTPEVNIPDIKAPVYGRLERQLAQYREEIAAFDINEQLVQTRQKKQKIRAAILPGKSANALPVPAGGFNTDAFIYLLMKLLHKKFTPSERLAVHTLWHSTGPIDEQLVRKTVGRLLGEEHPMDDLKGYLEEIRLAVLTDHKI